MRAEGTFSAKQIGQLHGLLWEARALVDKARGEKARVEAIANVSLAAERLRLAEARPDAPVEGKPGCARPRRKPGRILDDPAPIEGLSVGNLAVPQDGKLA